jgi:hypothetical protein
MTRTFYAKVPKQLRSNIRFRREMERYGRQGPSYANEVACACSRDILFWANTFLWLYEARPGEGAGGGSMVPFITWPFQDETFEALESCYGKRDVHIEKSRDMGATWMSLTFALWKWQFHRWQSILLVSRNESLVDSRDNPDALFPKLRMLLRWQPKWLVPTLSKQDDAQLHLFNPETDSVIDGASTTSNTGVGGRRTMMFLDEFALVEDAAQMFSATRDVSRNRLFVSTPRGENQFHKIKKTNAFQISLHWTRHPTKSQGLYKVSNNSVQILDTKYKFADDFKFVTAGPFFFNGKVRSPWYDAECERASHPREIRQELDIDYLGSTDQFFGHDVIARQENLSLEPYARGELDFNTTTLENIKFVPSSTGRLLLWMNLSELNKPVGVEAGVILGADVSQGTGASNSSLHARCKRTGTQIAEFADPNMDPFEFGRYAVALAKWLENAHLVIEANGPGSTAIKAVNEAHYTNVYYRKDYDKLGAEPKDVVGWWSSNKTKRILMDNYQFGLRTGVCTERSRLLVGEMRQYIHHGGAEPVIIHAGSTDDADPSGAGANHGDRVIAAALSYFRFSELKRTNKQEVPRTQHGTFGDFRKRLEREAIEAESRFW